MVLSEIKHAFRAQKKTNDDLVDRISHHWVVLLLIIFVIITTSELTYGDPIHCWCPAQFTDTYVDYANTACWVENTYYVDIEEPIPADHFQRSSSEIKYYQWVPMILAVQALLFKLPNVIWKSLHRTSGINLDQVVKLADQRVVLTTETRDESLQNVTEYLDRWLTKKKKYIPPKRFQKRMLKLCFWKKNSGKYIIFVYFMIKLLYLANSIGQFFLLDAFMDSSFHLLGFKVMSALSNGTLFHSSSPIFPTATLCDFKTRQMNNVHLWTVQCILTINLYNQRIFECIWFVLLIVSILTSCSILGWIYSGLKRQKEMFVKQYLKHHEQLHDGNDKHLMRRFVSDHLGADGIFILNVVSQNSSTVFSGDLVVELWKLYKSKRDGNYADDEDGIDEKSTRDDISMSGLAPTIHTDVSEDRVPIASSS